MAGPAADPFHLIDVAVLTPAEGAFTYRVGADLASRAQPGARLLVPFGRRRMTGIALGPGKPEAAGGPALKDVLEAMDADAPALTPPLLDLLRWTSDYYLHPLGMTLRAALPSALVGASPSAPPTQSLFDASVPDLEAALATLRRSPAQAAALAFLAREGPTAPAALKAAGIGAAALRALERKGLVTRRVEAAVVDPFAGSPVRPDAPPTPTPAQAAAIDAIAGAVTAGDFRTFLLHGATGSGKTEVYLRTIARALERGTGAIVLVPEIALTPQLTERFRARFGERVAVQHSGLTDRERADQWRRIRRGELPIVIGARSAVFAPIPRLGAIIVDEEHEGSYKQEENLPYHARDVAVMRAKIESAVAVLGSATPSLESLYNAEWGRYTRLDLPERVHARALPRIELVDMRAEKTPGGSAPVLSRALREAMGAAIARGEQTILFLNRRGFATQLFCHDCGHAFACPNCDISLVLHAGAGRARSLRCHACGHSEPRPEACAKCGGPGTELRGIGTQRVEEEVRRALPGARTARLDRDSAARRGAQAEILARLRAGEVDVLIGTQMVAKGHDFPGVTVVGVISAESSLHFPDFRAAERTFQLLVQVAGRAGRGDREGVVLIQTYDPLNACLTRVQAHDGAGFYAAELDHRRDPRWPPYCRLVHLRVSAQTAPGAEAAAVRCADAARAAAGADPAARSDVEVLGPAPAAIARVRNRWRWQVLLKGNDPAALRRVARAVLRDVGRRAGRERALLAVDVDPGGMV